MKKYLFLLFSFLYTHFLLAQAPSIIWDKTIGGSDTDARPKIISLSGGGYLIAGTSDSEISGSKTTINRGRNDYWLIKIDEQGNKLWDKNFGGASFDYLTDIIQGSDGGIVLAGHSSSNAKGEKSQNTRGGSTDYWIVKVDINGNKLWDKTFGGESSDTDPKIIETNDGGYLIAGISISQNGFDKSEASRGLSDYWIIKVDALGNKLWDKTIGGNENDFLSDIIKLNDGSFIISGDSMSGSSSEKTENSKGDSDFWIIKISSNGQKIWDKTFGGQFSDINPKLLLLNDSNLIITGYSQSSSSGDKKDTNKGVGNFWVIKINLSGNILWNKTVGGANSDFPKAITSTVEGGFIISGDSNSGQSGDKSEVRRGDTDFWIVKFDNNGNIIWNKTIGGDLLEGSTDITQSTDGGFVVVGHSNSGLSGEKTENSKGDLDYWIVKLGGGGGAQLPTPTLTVLDTT